MPLRHIARVALFFALTVVGFIIARVVAERDVRRDSDRRAEVAAVQIHGQIAQAASLTESLRRFMLDARSTGVTSDQFARNALRWLGPARFPAAAWVEQVPDSGRAAYERRIGQAIVTADARSGVVPLGSRSSYLPATLVTGFPPMAVPGIDLSGASGLAAALSRATRRNGVVATPLASPITGTRGLFLVAPAPNLIGEVLRPGYVVVFVSALGLRAAATGVPVVQVGAAGGSAQARDRRETSIKSFTAAGQRFTVVVPREPVQGGAAVLPWVILAGGVLVVALGGALGLYAARRARAQEELDRIFTMSQDLIAVADFDGRFTRVNPAAEAILGYTEEELLARPYIDLVHPADRDSTVAEADALTRGKPTVSFENRYVRRDGSVRVLDWTVTPDVEKRLMYAVARDVTERRNAEAEVKRLADEQAALRRVATLVASDPSPAELFTVIAEECAQLFGTEDIGMVRYEGDRHQVVMASSGTFKAVFPTGSRQPLGGDNAASLVFRTGRSARIDDYARASGPIADAIRPIGLRCAVATPIMVEGGLWGAMIAGTSADEPLPLETESRLGQFTELMATAIANAEARAQVERLAEVQAALRRVAMLVAREASQEEIFTAVAKEMRRFTGAEEIRMMRYEDDGTAVAIGGAGEREELTPIGTRVPLGGNNVTTRIWRTREPVRIDNYPEAASGPIAVRSKPVGVRSGVGAPILVEGRLWGTMGAATYRDQPLEPDAESRMGELTDLMATAIANAKARAEIERLAEEQAALRRVATLVAEDASPTAVFDAAAAELGALLHAHGISLCRYEPGDELTVVAHLGSQASRLPPGTRVRHDSKSVTAIVRRTQRPARLDSYPETGGTIGDLIGRLAFSAGVGAPIVVEGRLWGVTVANWTDDERPPPDTEQRMAQFTELLGTAIANADSRDQLTASRARLLTAADEARRRVVRDLHDGAQQRLVHTIVTLKLARRALRGGEGDAGSLVDEALDHAGRGNEELRELAHGIHPSALTSGGLRGGVRTVVKRLDLPVDVDVLAERLPPEIEASAYFIVAEALTNVVKHSQAVHAEVTASVRDGMLDVQVRDDGIGGADPGGHGLVGMKDRVAALGGRLEIASPAGGGTCVAAMLPLAQAAFADSP
jgi:PAS domain S-box-containing protein